MILSNSKGKSKSKSKRNGINSKSNKTKNKNTNTQTHRSVEMNVTKQVQAVFDAAGDKRHKVVVKSAVLRGHANSDGRLEGGDAPYYLYRKYRTYELTESYWEPCLEIFMQPTVNGVEYESFTLTLYPKTHNFGLSIYKTLTDKAKDYVLDNGRTSFNVLSDLWDKAAHEGYQNFIKGIIERAVKEVADREEAIEWLTTKIM